VGNNTSTFLARFARYPMRVGAVAPSSALLARQAVAPVPRLGEPVVVELGPGTGAFTCAIQERLGGRGYHLAVEIDEVFASGLRARYPQVDVVVGDAATLPDVLAQRGIAAADVVVSGLPWAAFSPTRTDSVLAAVAASLVPHGAFTTFAYLHARWAPAARRLRRELEWTFQEVVTGRTVWRNLPAALVYHARSPALLRGRKSSSTRPKR
jgi:phosphatidylethanolamine/phosphatidyl-N-methylethanolamine N-methyltransferase